MEVRRINDICPCCGAHLETFDIDFKYRRVNSIETECPCGFSVRIEDTGSLYIDGQEPIVTDQDPIDRWNKLAGKCNDM